MLESTHPQIIDGPPFFFDGVDVTLVMGALSDHRELIEEIEPDTTSVGLGGRASDTDRFYVEIERCPYIRLEKRYRSCFIWQDVSGVIVRDWMKFLEHDVQMIRRFESFEAAFLALVEFDHSPPTTGDDIDREVAVFLERDDG